MMPNNITNNKRPRVLMIAEQCNPEGFSVPLVAYKLYERIREFADITLVTHERFKAQIENVRSGHEVVYIKESRLAKLYKRCVHAITRRKDIFWRLEQILTYPLYAEFNHRVYALLGNKVNSGHYDVVHGYTPIIPRYPYKIVKNCKKTPFLLGPVNGGLPFFKQFNEVRKSEWAILDYVRNFNRLIPGYTKTYKTADHILAASSNTYNQLTELFDIEPHRMSMFYENGLTKSFFNTKAPTDSKICNLLFSGRLIKVKGPDMVIEAIAGLSSEIKQRVHLTLVGEGVERQNLEAKVQELGLDDQITFTGWVTHNETLEYYKKSHIFCFPSIREFGGAVVLEAMANGLPCIVTDFGGIGEYVTENCGIKIPMTSREDIVNTMTNAIKELVINRKKRNELSVNAVQRAREFEWAAKARDLLDVYKKLIKQSDKVKSGSNSELTITTRPKSDVNSRQSVIPAISGYPIHTTLNPMIIAGDKL